MQTQYNQKALLKSLLNRCLLQILIYKHRYKSRRALSKLDDRILSDVGISKDQAELEIQKPFWKGDSVVFDMNDYSRFKQRMFLDKTLKSRGVSF